VDGKKVDTRPLKVVADPGVALTAVERKKLLEMAMETHELQRVANQFSGALTPLSVSRHLVGEDRYFLGIPG
jgi:hypothetical protein